MPKLGIFLDINKTFVGNFSKAILARVLSNTLLAYFQPYVASWRVNLALTISPGMRPRFPAEIISPRVWMYFRFCLSYCDVEELMLERGVIVPCEVIRQ
jgi:hypothetical protein